MHDGGRRLNLLGRVTSLLARARIPHALIGAAALALHGVSRSTHDIDLLATDPSCLAQDFWAPLAATGVTADVRRGDSEDPLAGVIRLTAPAEDPVDLVLGRARWQAEALARAERKTFADVELPVLRAADLILLKLYAGGPQDAWDIAQLLSTAGGERLSGEVEGHLGELPPAATRLWHRISSVTE